ncbi:uncharacterized protein [Nicotiana sylvestris]|uniref:uncharacterized protein n=1 Tax=Nicotiana sylvestris TaxID=4096 RepID=UPI00388CB69A
MVEKGCVAYLAYVGDISIDTPTIELVPVVWDFPDIFPADLLGMPPDRDIDFGINLLPDTQPLSIPPYHMAPHHVVLSKEIKVDSKKVEAVPSWPRPSSAMEIWSFLGLSGYYRRFVEVFSSIAAPMTRVTQKHLFKQKDLNLCQRRWLELLKDYDITILYHPVKAIVVADALSHRAGSLWSLAYFPAAERPLALDVPVLANQFVRLDISKERQYDDPYLLVLKNTVQHGDSKKVTIGDDGALRMYGRLSVPNVDGLCELILQKTHNSRYSIHPGATKMYQDLRQHYWWRKMKKDIVEYLARVYIREIVKFHGVSVSIISDWGTQFTSRFWRVIQ